MSKHNTYKGFFSYSHHDAETDPGLVKAFTTLLEDRVNAKLANARFKIWRDEEGLRTGDTWNEKLEAQLKASDVMIVLLTPRWIESEYCRKEYIIFEEIEFKREVGEYVVPILARTIEKQEKYLTAGQREVYKRIASRQYLKAIVTEFLKLKKSDRTSLIDKLVDDLEGMVERRRAVQPKTERPSKLMFCPRKPREFDAGAQNYERVDFVTDGEVVLDRSNDDGERFVLAHAGFVERLYIQGERGRIEFGVRRAFLSLDNKGLGNLSKLSLKGGSDVTNVYYATLHEAPDAITVCIDPPAGKASLAELPLPPSRNKNYLSRIAIASREVRASQLKAELIVSLNACLSWAPGTICHRAPRRLSRQLWT
jgi:TIR domain